MSVFLQIYLVVIITMDNCWKVNCQRSGPDWERNNHREEHLIAIYSGRHSVPPHYVIHSVVYLLVRLLGHLHHLLYWAMYLLRWARKEAPEAVAGPLTSLKWTGAFVGERCIVNKLCLNYSQIQVMAPCNISFWATLSISVFHYHDVLSGAIGVCW